MTPDEFAAQIDQLVAEARDKGLSNRSMGEALLSAAENLVLIEVKSDRLIN
jgi:glutamine synthetase adenylyltransferase